MKNAFEHPISATNLDLFRFLAESGWTDEQLLKLRSVYGFTARFSFDSFRANWKPFLCHLVGVASIVAWDSKDTSRVAAALAHSALDFGQFPLLVRFRPGGLGRYLDRKLGVEISTLVKAYNAADWKRLMSPEAQTSGLDSVLRHLKLADMLDDLVDEVSPVQTQKKIFVSRDDPETLANCAAICGTVEAPALARAYEKLASFEPYATPIIESRWGTFRIRRGWRR